MTTFLSFVALIAGLVGLVYMLTGPAFVGPVWWILAIVSLVGLAVLNLLKRIAVATEKASAGAEAASTRPR